MQKQAAKKSASELISDAYEKNQIAKHRTSSEESADDMKFKTPWGSRKKQNVNSSSSTVAKVTQGTVTVSRLDLQKKLLLKSTKNHG